ncbi:MAG TPA: HAMP domain-containing sensor histidine kinase [Kofleriaceae bacterium]|nr:HAMP domain-containing sensor histidine kinase [Kofleriaceae bacterium]
MKTPAFIAEAIAPANRNKLRFGIYTGYAMAAMFAILAATSSVFELTPWRWAFIGLISTKLLTTSVAWLALVRDRFVATTQVISSTADVVLLTGAIYFTGGPYSPLIATYVIVVAAVALLSNVGATLVLCGGIVLAFTSMMIGMATGILPPTAEPGAPGQIPTAGYTLTAIIYCIFVVGVPAYFCAAILSTLRTKERDLEARTAQLIAANTQRSQFVASMTHELRTPIHGVQGLADVIAAGVYGPVTDKQKEAVATIKRSAQSLLVLVDDVLNLARADANRIEAHPTPIDIGALVGRVVASVTWMIGTKKINLASDVEPELPFVQSDDRWLAHVLVNLVSNAVKFTPEGGTVTVRAYERQEHDAVVLEVKDTGIGISRDDRHRIFEPFRQADDKADTKGFGGVGLGLALVARLTDLLGAKVELDSEVSKGSTFRVIVPLDYKGRAVSRVMRAVVPPADADLSQLEK